MKTIVGILQTDELPDDFFQSFLSLENVYAKLLEEPTIEFKLFRVFKGEIPRLQDADVFIIGGSRESVYTESSTTQVILQLIKKLDQARKPLIGICYGHQAVAYALGGKVEASPKGWEVGITQIELQSGRDSILPESTETTINLPSFHHDEVTQLPPHARLLASNSFSQVQAFAIDQHIICFQGHPEFTSELLAYFLASGRNNIGPTDQAAAEESLSLPNHREKVGRILRHFIKHHRIDNEAQRSN